MAIAWDAVKKTSVGHELRLLLLGVFMPGVLVLLELWLLLINDVPRDVFLLQFVSEQTRDIDGWVLVTAGLIGLLVAFSTGYVCRTAVWGVAKWTLRPPNLTELKGKLQASYPERGRSILAELERETGFGANDDENDPVLRRRRTIVLVYCKSWLRMYVPQMNVDHIEVEINALYALPLPLLLGSLTLIQWFGGSTAIGAAALVIASVSGLWALKKLDERRGLVALLCVAGGMLVVTLITGGTTRSALGVAALTFIGLMAIRLGNHRQQVEVEDAVRNFVLARSFFEEDRGMGV